MKRLWEQFLDLFSDEEDFEEPFFDPVHLAATIIVCIAGIGCLYWLLWTFLVYEGGLFLKFSALIEILLTDKTWKDFGYESAPYAMGTFQGWIGNSIALLLFLGLICAFYYLYKDAAKKRSK